MPEEIDWENAEIIECYPFGSREPYYQVWASGKLRFITSDKDYLTNMHKPCLGRADLRYNVELIK